MQQREIARRTVLKTGAAASLSGLAVLKLSGPAQAFPGHSGEGILVPWLDPTPPVPPENAEILAHPLDWEAARLVADTQRRVLHGEALQPAGPLPGRLAPRRRRTRRERA